MADPWNRTTGIKVGSAAALIVVLLTPIVVAAQDESSVAADRGRLLFAGTARFANGGPACAECHDIAGLPFPSGGSVGPDLTRSYSKYGPEPLETVLSTLYFPTMQALFAQRVLTQQERRDLTAFFQRADTQRAPKAATRDPGASEVLTAGPTRSPRSTAFLASRPAAIMRPGLEVFVQDEDVPVPDLRLAARLWPRCGRVHLVGRRSVVHHLPFGEGIRLRQHSIGEPVGILLAASAPRPAGRRAGGTPPASADLCGGLAEAIGWRRREQLAEARAQLRQVDSLLRTLGTRYARPDRGEVELDTTPRLPTR
jgi:mono/diheme cytochrome c family protein